MTQASTTRDHDTIRKWAETRKGRPAKVDTGTDGGILRIDFGEPEAGLTEIEWEEFFEIFDAEGLQFLHQEKTEDGKTSRFSKFIAG